MRLAWLKLCDTRSINLFASLWWLRSDWQKSFEPMKLLLTLTNEVLFVFVSGFFKNYLRELMAVGGSVSISEFGL